MMGDIAATDSYGDEPIPYGIPRITVTPRAPEPQYDPFTGMPFPTGTTQDRPVNVPEAYQMGGLAGMDQYQPADAPHEVWNAYDKLAREAEQRRADPFRLPNATLTEAGLEDPTGGAPLSTSTDVGAEVGKLVVPTTPQDIGLWALGGPFGKGVKAAALGLGALFEPGEAQGGAGNIATRGAQALRNAMKMGELAGVQNYVPSYMQHGAMWQHAEPLPIGGFPSLNDIKALAPAIGAGDNRVSTRFPSGVNAIEDPLAQHLSIGLDEMRASPGFARNIEHVRQTPGMGFMKGMSDEEAAQAYIQRLRDNMTWLYRQSPEVMQQRSPAWYEGAHRIASDLADRWGLPRTSTAADLASLSPQKDWFQNASLGERVGDIMTSAAAGKPMTSDMLAYAAKAAQNPKDFPEFWSKPDAIATINRIAGKSFDQLERPLDKAIWLRLYDEAHNSPLFRSVTPEGDLGDWVRTGKGVPQRRAWGSGGEIVKAIQSLESGGDPRVISPILGYKHKVRGFYNNIENPWDVRFGDVTSDTHQVGAGQLRAVSGDTPAVQANLGSGGSGWSASDLTGVQGTYGLLADATRQAAGDLGLRASQGQSGVWEPIRTLFPREWKSATNKEAIDNIWRAHDRGELTLDQARNEILARSPARGIGTPDWARSGPVSDVRRGSTYR